MISWEPIEMRLGERIDRAVVDGERTPGEDFVRRRSAGVERFAINAVDLPPQANEAAALATWQALPNQNAAARPVR